MRLRRMLRVEPLAGDTYTLPSGAVVTVLLVAYNETVICHYLKPDGTKQRGKAAAIVLTPEFLMKHCTRSTP